jgi:hypothetical protein
VGGREMLSCNEHRLCSFDGLVFWVSPSLFTH